MNETPTELRYGFGKNWAEYVKANLNDGIIEDSRRHISEMLRADDLRGKVVLDIGCGSGIHSLAALRMGAAKVVSFDYDEDSVATTRRVREFAQNPENWEVFQGSVLDVELMRGLPKADIVYSWGVLHHTGDMWTALKNAVLPLKADGVLYIALYSSDNYVDPPPSYWLDVKRRYNSASAQGRRLMEWRYMMRFHFFPELRSGRNPFELIRKYGTRGMTYWTDVKDWLGGWPMEFSGLKETEEFYRREFALTLVNVLTGEGCTEYVFARPDCNEHWRSVIESRRLVSLAGPFRRQNGHAYSAALPALERSADAPSAPRCSKLMLYEDGVLLGLAHSTHDHVARFGGGRFSHWGSEIVFSPSDNSDPNTNGRVYSYCERF